MKTVTLYPGPGVDGPEKAIVNEEDAPTWRKEGWLDAPAAPKDADKGEKSDKATKPAKDADKGAK